MERLRESGFFAGVAATLAMLTVMLAGRTYLGIGTPVELMADWLIPLLPMEWFEIGLTSLGGSAKPLFYIAVLLGLLLLGGLLGVLFRWMRNRRPGVSLPIVALAWAAGLTLLTGLALLPIWGEGWFGSRSDTGPVGTTVFYFLAYLMYSGVLAVAGLTSEADHADRIRNEGRRVVLRRTLVGGGAVVLAATLGPQLWRFISRISLTEVQANPVGMPEPFTPIEEFYTVSKNLVAPEVNLPRWRLSIEGLVEQPYGLTLDEIRSLPSVEQAQTLACISNPVGGNLIGNALWKGVPLRDLLRRAGLRGSAVDIRFSCADGYTESIPVDKALEEDVVLAYEMNGEPLNDEHGSPTRLLVPNIYGMKNVKWLEKIEAVPHDYLGFWQNQGWSDVAIINTMSQIRAPGPGAELPAGQPVDLGGIAFAGTRGVERVEWSPNGGRTWLEARLLPPIGEHSWRFWHARWMPEEPGEHTLVVRATDGENNIQTAERRNTLPDGATGLHSIRVSVTQGAT